MVLFEVIRSNRRRFRLTTGLPAHRRGHPQVHGLDHYEIDIRLFAQPSDGNTLKRVYLNPHPVFP
jgi:hypothetical protein